MHTSDGIDPAQYDAQAHELAAHMEAGPYNVLYERPAVRDLIGAVAGLRVLDAACGAGSLTVELVDAGAQVVAVDASQAMLAIARDRLGARAEMRVQDCNEAMPWAGDSSFDLVVMSLAYHYLTNPIGFLRELHRVLTPEGAVVISTHHPTDDFRRLEGSYFSNEPNTDLWGDALAVTANRWSLTDIASHFDAADFVIDRLIEPRPSVELERAAPDVHAKLAHCPAFILFRLVKR